MDPLKMYFLLKMVVFQPAMLDYRRVPKIEAAFASNSSEAEFDRWLVLEQLHLLREAGDGRDVPWFFFATGNGGFPPEKPEKKGVVRW